MKSGVRRKILAEWRGAEEPNEGSPPQPLAKILDITLKKLGVQDRLVEDQIVEVWQDIVGEFHARNARPVQIKRGVLVVAVAQPSVLYNLERFHKPELLRRLQEEFGEKTIRNIRFRAGN